MCASMGFIVNYADPVGKTNYPNIKIKTSDSSYIGSHIIRVEVYTEVP